MRTSMCSALAAVSLIAAISGSAWAQDAAPAAPGAVATAKASLNLDTPIAVIAADPRGKAVLDKDLPGLTIHPMFESFKNDSLKQFQPKTSGAISDDSLAVTAKDLAALDTPQGR